MLKTIHAADLENFVKDQDEKDYQVVDIRSEKEYSLDHIPGSVNVPFAEIQSGNYQFDGDKKLILCCRSGRRSQVAVILISESGYAEDQLYNLTGGLMEYTGEILLEYPKLDLFASDGDPIKLMKRAIDLEKGAFKFYSIIQEKFCSEELKNIMDNMAQAEISHARLIFNTLIHVFKLEMQFDEFFDSCEGRILEGGKSIEDVKGLFDGNPPASCLDILEFAVELEFCAYDLYKIVGTKIKETKVQKMFIDLAQTEKKHLEKIIRSFDLCDDLK